MSEYWKSNPRKFCVYCKCWFADNKSSIEFHERGKRHKEAVQAKINELQKKGLQDAQNKERFKSDILKMEEAAMAALKEDLKRDPSLATAYGLQIKESGCAPAPVGYQEPEPEPEPPKQKPKNKQKKLWKETKSAEGYPYYWNTETGEVTWTKPDDFEPESEIESESAAKSSKSAKTKDSKTKSSEKPAVSKFTATAAIPLPSDWAVNKKTERHTEKRSGATAYGAWTPVENQNPEMPDLQLPPSVQPRATTTATASTTNTEPPKITFKQKTLSSIGGVGSKTGHTGIVFKRRKVNASNVRARDGDS